MRLLPQSYQTPLHFSDAELALLQGTPLLSAAIDRRETTKAALEKARRLFEHGNGNGIGKTFLHLMDSLEKEIPGYALDLWRRMETAYDRWVPKLAPRIQVAHTEPIIDFSPLLPS